MADLLVHYYYSKIDDPKAIHGFGCIILPSPLNMSYANWKIEEILQKKVSKGSYAIIPCCVALLKDCEINNRVNMISYILHGVSCAIAGAAIGLVSNLLK